MTALSRAEGRLRDAQYIFSVPESMEDNNVVMSFNIMPQNLKAKEEKFPLSFKVFKVRQSASGLAFSDICVFLVQREREVEQAGRFH